MVSHRECITKKKKNKKKNKIIEIFQGKGGFLSVERGHHCY